ncbi:MAG: hypothetical protein K0Q52_1906 [Microbacterium sp.]|jgi:hypothetical protein|nr:hypothetical protein [Microbacterium sp.]
MQSRRELARIANATEALSATPTGHRSDTGPDVNPGKEKLPIVARLNLWWGAGPARERRMIRILAQYSIVAIVGSNGAGKTLCMMVLTSPTRNGVWWECDNPDHLHTQAGVTSGYRRMLSTTPILDGNGGLHPLYDPFDDYEQLVNVEHADVYMDEANSVASSRASSSMDRRVEVKLQQLRKADVFLYLTAPDFSRIDVAIRQVTKVVVECAGYAPAPDTGESGQLLWRPRRVFRFSAYDAVLFDKWNINAKDKPDAIGTLWFKGPGSDAFRAYDTLASVSVIASMTPQDTCTVCEGRIVRHTCKGHTRPARPALASDALTLTDTGAPSEPVAVDAPA